MEILSNFQRQAPAQL